MRSACIALRSHTFLRQNTLPIFQISRKMEENKGNENIDVNNFTIINEGSAKILFPKTTSNDVFYNAVQEFNRDITIAVTTEYGKRFLKKKNIVVHESKENNPHLVSITDDEIKEQNVDEKHVYPGRKCEDGITILEALSASGLRSVRMASELPGVKKIVANDISEKAFEAIKRNISFNNVDNIVEASLEDACVLMLQHKHGRREQFDVVDIDPYGTAAPFLNSAVQAVKPSGLLCVTCTDMAVLAGNTPEKCWSKYRSMPLKLKACHEQALRILLSNIEQHANIYSRYIEPLISISVDFYIRVFVQVHYGPGKVKDSASKQSYIVRCAGCGSFTMHPVCQQVKTEKSVKYVPGLSPYSGQNCEFCGHQKHTIGGPLWNGPLHNEEFVKAVLAGVQSYPKRFKTHERINGILSMITEELQDVPMYYVISELASSMKIDSPAEKLIRSAICNAGYKVSSFHGRTNSLKTNAPNSFIWDVLKSWVQKFSKINTKKDQSPYAKALIEREVTQEVDFTVTKVAEAQSKRKGIKRFPELPANWGPKARAKVKDDGSIELSESLEDKRKRLQGKRKNITETNNNNKSLKTEEGTEENNT